MEKILVGDTKMAGNMAGGTTTLFATKVRVIVFLMIWLSVREKRYVNIIYTEFSFLIWMFTKGTVLQDFS